MVIADLKSDIQNNTLANFYIFAGDEWKIQEIYINQISKVTGKDIRHIDSVSDIYSSVRNTALIKKSYVYVVHDDKELMTNEKLQNQLSDVLHDNILILILSNVDKRIKFYKSYSSSIIEFEKLNSAILKNYICRSIQLKDANLDTLIEVCEGDYGRCLLESDKIKSYAEITNVDYDKAFRTLIADGTISCPPKDAIFDFINAILSRNPKKSCTLYNECLNCGEAVMVMVSVLYTNAKSVLQVQSYKGNDIEKSTGLTNWQVRNARNFCNVYSNRELINIMSLCYDCQKSIVTGTIDEEFVMPYIMSNIF